MSTRDNERPDTPETLTADTGVRWSEPAHADPHLDPTRKDMAAIARLAERMRGRMDRWQTLISRRPWLRFVYRGVLTLVAVVVILAGIAMLVLPGPGWLTIFLGLAILGSEFAWARHLLGWLRKQVQYWWHRYRAWRQRRAGKTKGAPHRADETPLCESA